MSLGLFSLIGDDYDSAIRFFTGTLKFELAEDRAAQSDEGHAKR